MKQNDFLNEIDEEKMSRRDLLSNPDIMSFMKDLMSSN